MAQKTQVYVENYPLILKAEHICEILGVSKPTAYELFKQPGFPALELPGRIRRVQRDAFFRWLHSQERKMANGS